ncbi:TerC family protein [Buchnera aphidicola (Neophyllaphis varicolor)]|uniref:TerC family protein n=1 Tax=Buchnera aphidicola TaxID=9 RepID=UPI0031B81868
MLILDPSIWAGLITLIILEIVLGIDNLIFIAILVEKLPEKKRDQARFIGLFFALLMRIGLLLIVSWLTSLTSPIIKNSYLSLSSRDLILLFGGIFLLIKSITELNERIENNQKENNKNNEHYSSFWAVVIQIIILDAIFSLDAIITAVGIVTNLLIMICSITIAMSLMLLASKTLTKFINLHQTIVVLCLSFLIMIGLSLIAESLGFHIQKGYLYAAVGFSIIIEILNQVARRNFIKNQSNKPLRQRVAEAIIRIMLKETPENTNKIYKNSSSKSLKNFKKEEKYMINSILTLASRSIRSIMTTRGNISWVNSDRPTKEIYSQLLDTPHSLFPVCKGTLDEVIGIVRAKELLVALDKKIDVASFASKSPAIIVPETLDPIKLLGVLRKSKGSCIIVTNEFGVVQGLITPLDVLEAIAGEFPDADETPDIITEKNNSWLVKGSTDIHYLQQLLETSNLSKKEGYTSLAGFLIEEKGRLPFKGEIIIIKPFKFNIIEVNEYRINLVRITKI